MNPLVLDSSQSFFVSISLPCFVSINLLVLDSSHSLFWLSISSLLRYMNLLVPDSSQSFILTLSLSLPCFVSVNLLVLDSSHSFILTLSLSSLLRFYESFGSWFFSFFFSVYLSSLLRFYESLTPNSTKYIISTPLIFIHVKGSAGRLNYWLLICEMLYLRYTLRHIFWAPLWLDKMNAWFKLENCTLKGSINIKIFLWFFHERASIYYHYAQKKMKMWHSCIDAR